MMVAGSCAARCRHLSSPSVTVATCHVSVDTRELVSRPEVEVGQNCSQCWGCNTVLRRLPRKMDQEGMVGQLTVFEGGSGAGVFFGTGASGEEFFVKFWCGLDGQYRHTVRHNPVNKDCPSPNKRVCPLKGGVVGEGDCNHRYTDAIQRVADAAGLSAITPRSWKTFVRSTLTADTEIPAVGHSGKRSHRGLGLPAQLALVALSKQVNNWARVFVKAQGVAIEAISRGNMKLDAYELLRKIPSEQVLMAGYFDLLMSEQDRHGQNVLVDKDGNMQIIDSERAFLSLNSIFLPGTQKYEIYRIGYNAVCCGNLPGRMEDKCPGKKVPSSPDVMFDFRCHVPGGVVGKKYPKRMKEFLTAVDRLSVDDVRERFGMTRQEHAQNLKQRVNEMLNLGFEGALQAALDRQPRGDGVRYGFEFSYDIHPPCCHPLDCEMRVEAAVLAQAKKDRESGRVKGSLVGSAYRQ
eukprot:jgi/Mesvir1/18816/Mv04308-RA.1